VIHEGLTETTSDSTKHYVRIGSAMTVRTNVVPRHLKVVTMAIV